MACRLQWNGMGMSRGHATIRFVVAPFLAMLAGCALLNARDGEAGADDVAGESDPDGGQVVEPAPEHGLDAAGPSVQTILIGGDAVLDTYLRNDEPTYNYGAEERFCTDSGGDDRRALLRFDLAAVGAPTITEATLHIVTDGGDSGQSPDVHLVYQVLEPWYEGGNAGEVGVASWFEAQAGVSWTTDGAGPGSRADAPVGSYTPITSETRYDVAIDPALVNAWLLEPDSNHGLAIVNGGGDATCYYSAEQAEPARRPTLTLVWTD
ncbi:MAG TPA: DNRLRE domain-containing protein [Kofleriaceae bacterium]|nr:DNRLRE domain-containing protein [Kofleriaceae bacterium]